MKKFVLIVDDDQEMLLAVKDGLEKYDTSLSVLIAGDGLIALEKLKKNTVSVVVTDLKMPRMDGISLLAHIMEHYPDIPVVIITAYSTSAMERMARDGGAIGYIEKPFMIEGLAKKIKVALQKESDGGTMQSVSSGTFLQMIEMEQRTCTLRMIDKTTGRQGVLFINSGCLLDARIDNLQGVDAAYEILSWEEVALSIQNTCPKEENLINVDLQALLLEAMRRKDEKNEARQAPSPPAAQKPAPVQPAKAAPAPKKTVFFAKTKKEAGRAAKQLAVSPPPASAPVDKIGAIRRRLTDRCGDRCGLEDIYQDAAWDGFVKVLSHFGSFFGSGALKAAYIRRGEPKDYIVMPDQPTIVVAVDRKGLRDSIMQALTT